VPAHSTYHSTPNRHPHPHSIFPLPQSPSSIPPSSISPHLNPRSSILNRASKSSIPNPSPQSPIHPLNPQSRIPILRLPSLNSFSSLKHLNIIHCLPTQDPLSNPLSLLPSLSPQPSLQSPYPSPPTLLPLSYSIIILSYYPTSCSTQDPEVLLFWSRGIYGKRRERGEEEKVE
jgi:hypothetical protein